MHLIFFFTCSNYSAYDAVKSCGNRTTTRSAPNADIVYKPRFAVSNRVKIAECDMYHLTGIAGTIYCSCNNVAQCSCFRI